MCLGGRNVTGPKRIIRSNCKRIIRLTCKRMMGKLFLVNPLDYPLLHLGYLLSEEGTRDLRLWDEAVRAEPPFQPIRWHMALARYLRSATVTASTRIEGNPMSLTQVDALLQGERVDAPAIAQLENVNYNNALDLATTFALTPDFEWSETIIRALNHTIMRNLPDDRQGRYREEPVSVAGFYSAPEHPTVSRLMHNLIAWLRDSEDEHPLIRAALLHLNMVAIHPFLDGNGRTARIVCSLEMMRSRVGAPELISVEPYLAEHRDEYFKRLAATLGPSYQPDRHDATPWVQYYVRLSAGRLELEARLREALPLDVGSINQGLEQAGEPLSWGWLIHWASVTPIRTRQVAGALHRSMPNARALLGAMNGAGWLRREGRTRGAVYHPGERLLALDLRTPVIVERYVHGDTLGLDGG